MEDGVYERRHKLKGVVEEREYNLFLALKFNGADGIDDPSSVSLGVAERLYSVVFWVHPEKKYTTKRSYAAKFFYDQQLDSHIVTSLDPIWQEQHEIELDKSSDCRFLYVEVIRHGFSQEPSTSRGTVCVGRARIPLPKKYSVLEEENQNQRRAEKRGRYGLVRLDRNGCKKSDHRVRRKPLSKGRTHKRARILKRKRSEVEEDFSSYRLALTLKFFGAEGIDNPRRHPIPPSSRIYRVEFWVDPERIYHTNFFNAEEKYDSDVRNTESFLNPRWDQETSIEVDTDTCSFLFVEVCRYALDQADTGASTSTGRVCVGKVRIPLPELIESKEQGRYGLMRPQGLQLKPEGHISLAMELSKLYFD
ncbi:hypothetical protein Tsubulata_007825 [Turnera subulata]|uniref:C2 domain-containing protein n=1 Tax=Turnera subulata TaxID=218843 RepID=A0A9Q0J503_9ROSI|nr:hypothetical protein Tsubulata_007825 [Turnera subulata]